MLYFIFAISSSPHHRAVICYFRVMLVTDMFVSFSLLIIPLINLSAAVPVTENKTCKALPGSQHWPSQQSWASLNKTLGGALLAPLPPAAVCDPSQAHIYDEVSCAKLATEWSNSSFHADNPVSIDWPNWQYDACLPTALYNQSTSCNLQPFPHYVVNATNANQVAAAVKFAANTGVRLSVKGTGHDFLGRYACLASTRSI